MQRRHDIDALRALAFALLILYHWGMLYVGGDNWGWHLKSTHTSEWLQWPMLFVNRWRMDLIFLISGLSVHFMLRDTRIGRFVAMRSWRLMLPLIFGMLVVVPIQPYAQGVTSGAVHTGFWQFLGDYLSGHVWPGEPFDGADGLTWNHLWYLAYLWVYTLAFVVLLPLLRRLPNPLARLRGGWLLTLPAIPLFVATVTLQPIFGTDGDLENDWYRHAIYFSMFLYGWWIGTRQPVWDAFLLLRKRATGWALVMFAAYAALVFVLPDDASQPQLLAVWTFRNAYIWLALSAILGWGHRLLNCPFKWLPWANASVYPWYILHQSLIILMAYWLLPLDLGPVAEPALVLLGTLGGCWLLTNLVSRIGMLRPCFGMKPGRRAVRNKHAVPTTPIASPRITP